jgi:hypothetical protein
MDSAAETDGVRRAWDKSAPGFDKSIAFYESTVVLLEPVEGWPAGPNMPLQMV